MGEGPLAVLLEASQVVLGVVLGRGDS